MQKKVLIISSPFFGYQESIANAFHDLGYTTQIETYDEPIHPFKGWLKWQHKFSFNREKLKEKHAVKYQKYIISRFFQFKPDMVLVLNGAILKPETLTAFKNTAKVVLWMYDSVIRYPKCINHIDYVDYAFFYEQKDVVYYQTLGKKAYFLPQAADGCIYHPAPCAKEIDILFIGVLYRYQKRIDFLRAVTEKFTDKKIVIIGKYKPFEKNPLKWLFCEKRTIYTNKNIPVNQVNNYYNRAKVVLNIHHETQQSGANPKVFEIPASGAYQICDHNPYIASLFPNGEIGLYKNEQELLDLIDDALRNDKSEQAQKAQHIVLSKHTFVHRINEILGIVGF